MRSIQKNLDMAPKATRSEKMAILKLQKGPERTRKLKSVFEEYLREPLYGNLSNRVRHLGTKVAYCHIVNHCFDGIDITDNKEVLRILPINFKENLSYLHAIDPASCGIFLDYLIRRIMDELRGNEFTDTRADKITDLDTMVKENRPIWVFDSDGPMLSSKEKISYWMVMETPNLNSLCVAKIPNGGRFVELSRDREWLKIAYANTTGWVRYLLPDVENPAGVSGNIKDYVPNEWFSIVAQDHYCYSQRGCGVVDTGGYLASHGIEIKIDTREIFPSCSLPICRNECYVKVKDTKKYHTRDILEELLITSTCHMQAFGECPDEDNILRMFLFLESYRFSVDPLYRICEKLLANCNNLIPNPILGGGVVNFGADCDLILDDTIVEIKCVKKDKINDILQLLGYASLSRFNNDSKINNVCVLNILRGECTLYNIQALNDDHLDRFLKLLDNKYDRDYISVTQEYKREGMITPAFYAEFRELHEIMNAALLEERAKKMRRFIKAFETCNSGKIENPITGRMIKIRTHRSRQLYRQFLEIIETSAPL